MIYGLSSTQLGFPNVVNKGQSCINFGLFHYFLEKGVGESESLEGLGNSEHF